MGHCGQAVAIEHSYPIARMGAPKTPAHIWQLIYLIYECTTATRHCKWPVVSSIPGRHDRLQVQQDLFHRAPELPLAPASACVLRHVPPGRSPHRAGCAQQRPCHPPLACHVAGNRPHALQGSFRGAEQADSTSWLAKQTKSAGDERQRSSHFQSSMHVTCEPKPLAAQLVGQLYIVFIDRKSVV